MSTITNFHPIKAINSLLQPLGLTLSNKQQVINKVAFAALAMLVVTCGLATVEAQSSTIRDANRAQSATECYSICGYINPPVCGYSDREANAACLSEKRALTALLTRCNAVCYRIWGE